MKKLAVLVLVLGFLTSCEKDEILPVGNTPTNNVSTSTDPSAPSYWGLKDTTPVPDALFEQFLVDKGLDDKVDGKLDTKKAMSYTGAIAYKVYANGQQTEMKSVEGLEAFVNITGLELVGCKVTSINLKNATKLKYVAIGNSQITTLDLSKCVDLEEVMCQNSTDYRDAAGNYVYGYTFGLTSIDLTNNLKLKNVWLWANRIKTLNVNHLKNLQVLWVNDNPYLESVDAVGIGGLYQIIANNCKNLSYINIKGTHLRQWDPTNPTIKASTPVYFNLENCQSLKKAYVQNVSMVSDYAVKNANFWKKDAQTEYVEAP